MHRSMAKMHAIMSTSCAREVCKKLVSVWSMHGTRPLPFSTGINQSCWDIEVAREEKNRVRHGGIHSSSTDSSVCALTLSWPFLPPVDVHKARQTTVLHRRGQQHQVSAGVLPVPVEVLLQPGQFHQALRGIPYSRPVELRHKES